MIAASVARQGPPDTAQQEERKPVSTIRRACACGGGGSSCSYDSPTKIRSAKTAGAGRRPSSVPARVTRLLERPGRALAASDRHGGAGEHFTDVLPGVTVHEGPEADEAARSIHADAFTAGSTIVLGPASRRSLDHRSRLLAHELTHVRQNGGVRPQAPFSLGEVDSPFERAAEAAAAAPGKPAWRGLDGTGTGSPVRRSVGPGIIQRQYPGDGMTRPGDCSWAQYLALVLSTESAKAVVSMLGRCGPNDSCNFLALKIAAITAEIAARVAVATICFKGGDSDHREQIDNKVNMLNRCYRFFQDKNCPQDLVEKMAAVVAAARLVIEQAATQAAAAVIVLAIAALVALIIALIDVIAAAAAAAAELAADAAVIATLTALLNQLLQQLQPAGG